MSELDLLCSSLLGESDCPSSTTVLHVTTSKSMLGEGEGDFSFFDVSLLLLVGTMVWLCAAVEPPRSSAECALSAETDVGVEGMGGV